MIPNCSTRYRSSNSPRDTRHTADIVLDGQDVLSVTHRQTRERDEYLLHWLAAPGTDVGQLLETDPWLHDDTPTYVRFHDDGVNAAYESTLTAVQRDGRFAGNPASVRAMEETDAGRYWVAWTDDTIRGDGRDRYTLWMPAFDRSPLYHYYVPSMKIRAPTQEIIDALAAMEEL